jgi:DNA topoisomerase-1
MVTMIRKAKRPQTVCINPDCPAKKIPFEEGKKCPKCNEGDLVLRKSVYGQFVACNKFPKCRYIVKKKKEDGLIPVKAPKAGKAAKPKRVAKQPSAEITSKEAKPAENAVPSEAKPVKAKKRAKKAK